MNRRLIFCTVMVLALAVVTPDLVAQSAEGAAATAQSPVEVTNQSAAKLEIPIAVAETNLEKSAPPAAPVATAAAAASGIAPSEVAAKTGAVAKVAASITALEPMKDEFVSELGGVWAEAESRTHRAVRINQNILMVAVPILAFFILARVALLWKITSARKRIARENNSLES